MYASNIIFTNSHTDLTNFKRYLLNVNKYNFLDFLIVWILSLVFNRTKVNIIAQITMINTLSKSSKFIFANIKIKIISKNQNQKYSQILIKICIYQFKTIINDDKDINRKQMTAKTIRRG